MSAFLFPEKQDLALPWANDARAKARDAIKNEPLPTNAEELWRYSRINALESSAFNESTAAAETSPVAKSMLAAMGLTPANEFIRELNDSDKDVFGSGEQSFETKLNTANLSDVVVIDVPANANVDKPIVVTSFAPAGQAIFPRVIVKAGDNSRFSIVEHQSGGDASLTVPLWEIELGGGAHVEMTTVQELPETSWLLSVVNSSIGRDATLDSFCASFGSYYARVVTNTSLPESGGTSNLGAAYFARGNQMHDFRSLQRHIGKKTSSDLLFKGAVDDFAESVYSGLIRISKGASGTAAYQTNRNLVLGEDAHADSVPNLEIDENDVKCSHASAVGPIDQEQRYYLQSRGIAPDVADRLIVQGFFNDVFERVKNEGLRNYLRHAVSNKWAAK